MRNPVNSMTSQRKGSNKRLHCVSFGSGFFIKMTEISKKNPIVKSITVSLSSWTDNGASVKSTSLKRQLSVNLKQFFNVQETLDDVIKYSVQK